MNNIVLSQDEASLGHGARGYLLIVPNHRRCTELEVSCMNYSVYSMYVNMYYILW